MDGISPYIIGGIVAIILRRLLVVGMNFRYRGPGYIKVYDFPETIQEKVIERYPHLSNDDVQRAISALKTYFIICNRRNGQMVSMPSQVVDIVWHEFILHTRRYKEFCDHGLGGFLHHTPASEMKSTDDMIKGLGRCWRLSCDYEGIDYRSPSRLPLLFVIDEELQILDGYKYALDQGIEGRYRSLSDNHGLSSSCGGGDSGVGCAGGGGCGGGCGGG